MGNLKINDSLGDVTGRRKIQVYINFGCIPVPRTIKNFSEMAPIKRIHLLNIRINPEIWLATWVGLLHPQKKNIYIYIYVYSICVYINIYIYVYNCIYTYTCHECFVRVPPAIPQKICATNYPMLLRIRLGNSSTFRTYTMLTSRSNPVHLFPFISGLSQKNGAPTKSICFLLKFTISPASLVDSWFL